MRISAEAQRVSIAQSELASVVLKFQREHDLSDIELLQALNSIEASTLKYMLRYERHGDYDTPAMEPPKLCDLRGPRIGEDVPRCRRKPNHKGKHRNKIEDGFGSVIEW